MLGPQLFFTIILYIIINADGNSWTLKHGIPSPRFLGPCMIFVVGLGQPLVLILDCERKMTKVQKNPPWLVRLM